MSIVLLVVNAMFVLTAMFLVVPLDEARPNLRPLAGEQQWQCKEVLHEDLPSNLLEVPRTLLMLLSFSSMDNEQQISNETHTHTHALV